MQCASIVRWERERRRKWNQHISRMNEDRLAKIVRDGKPQKPAERPQKNGKIVGFGILRG